MRTSRARKAVPRLRRSSNGMLMTPEEFDAAEIDDDLYIYELIRGVLIVSPRPSESERDPNEELGYLLRSYQAEHSQASPLDKTFYSSRFSGRAADVHMSPAAARLF